MIEHGTVDKGRRCGSGHHAMGPDEAGLHAVLGAPVLGQGDRRDHPVRRHLLHLTHGTLFFRVRQFYHN